MIWIMADAKRIVVGQPEQSPSLFQGLEGVDWFSPLLIGVVAYVFVANVVGFALMKADKSRAIAGQSRISEATLLLVALLGGGIGAGVARKMYRHKTRKQPFAALLTLAAIMNYTVLCILTAHFFSQFIIALF